MTLCLPGSTIGILGGGQLGRMMAMAARRMGFRVIVLDPSPQCPTAQVADGVVVGTLDDREAALHLAAQVDVLTLDTEHVPWQLLSELNDRVPVYPAPSVFRTVQDRMVQKQFLASLGLPQAPWAPAADLAELEAAVATVGLPCIIKVRRAGYDGKGQLRVTSATALATALTSLHHEPCVVEQVVPFRRELSVVLARDRHGHIETYALAENVHKHHVLHTTRVPAPTSPTQLHQARQLAITIATALDHIGVLAVEMFELADGQLVVNEIAPRTHNSGHVTLGAAATSQFEQHIRAICGLPLGSPRSLSGAVMLNLLGDLWCRATPPPWEQVLALPQARLHIYGKAGAAPGRKMGHVLLLDDDTDAALATAEGLHERLYAAGT